SELLPDAAEVRAAMEEVRQTYRSHGVEAGLKRFEEAVGMVGGPPAQPPGEPTPEMRERGARIAGNLEFFLAHGVLPLSGYAPDITALRDGSVRLVVGVGEPSVGQRAHRARVALAGRVGMPPGTSP